MLLAIVYTHLGHGGRELFCRESESFWPKGGIRLWLDGTQSCALLKDNLNIITAGREPINYYDKERFLSVEKGSHSRYSALQL